MTNCRQICTIGITEWCALAAEGSAPPVTVCLEGNSMMPLIRRGKDPVTIAALQHPLRVGDVVLLAAGADRYVVHRVWKINAAAIRTLGDNCANPDSWIPKDHVLGQAILYSRNNVKHRLDTTAARLWGRAWMAAFPLRKRCIQLKCIIRRCYKKLFLSHGPGGEGNEYRYTARKTEPADCAAECQRCE